MLFLKGGALGIAQIALATNQEGAAGGIDAAISWGIGTLAGIAGAALFSEKTVSTANLTFDRLSCSCCSSFVRLTVILLYLNYL
jgi:hypothetical protein